MPHNESRREFDGDGRTVRSAPHLARRTDEEMSVFSEQTAHQYQVFKTLLDLLVQLPADPIFGEPLDLRLDIKIDSQTNKYRLRLRVSCAYGNLMMSEISRVSAHLDEDERFATLGFEIQNNGIEIYDVVADMPSAA